MEPTSRVASSGNTDLHHRMLVQKQVVQPSISLQGQEVLVSFKRPLLSEVRCPDFNYFLCRGRALKVPHRKDKETFAIVLFHVAH